MICFHPYYHGYLAEEVIMLLKKYPVFMSDLILSPPVAYAASAEGEGKEDEDGDAAGSVQYRVSHLFCKL